MDTKQGREVKTLDKSLIVALMQACGKSTLYSTLLINGILSILIC